MPKLSLSIVCIVMLFSSCKKEFINKGLQASNTSGIITKTNLSGRWFATNGTFNWNNVYVPQDTLHEDSVIRGGYISIPHHDPSFPATINYNFPDQQNLDGDSITFQFVISDSSDEQMIHLVGSKGYVTIDHFKENWGIATPSVWQDKHRGYQSFARFTPVLIVFKNNVVSIRRGDRKLIELSYTGKLLGKLQSIELRYSSSMKCNEVKLYNSYSNKLLMNETFNLKGRSNTIFY
jgi:hypothetical protein